MGHLRWIVLFFSLALGGHLLADGLVTHFCVVTASVLEQYPYQSKFHTCYFSKELYYLFYSIKALAIIFSILGAICYTIRRWLKFVEKSTKPLR